MYQKYVRILAATAADLLREKLGVRAGDPTVAHSSLPELEFPVAQIIDYQGRDNALEGQFVLGFTDRRMALAVASALGRKVGLPKLERIDETAIDLLSEFMNLVVGRTISAWDQMGTPVNFGPPSSLLQAKISPTEGFQTNNYLITLPLAGSKVVFAVSFSQDGAMQANRPRVLVVDDSKTLRAFVSNHLEKNGYQAIQAGDGQEAVELYGEHRPEVCIMDLVMPRLGGLDAIMAIRQTDPEARFIILTSSDRMDERVTAKTLGVTEYLIKPFSEQELLAALERMLA